MKRILITGVNGFIGRNLAAGILSRGFLVSGCDQTGEPPENIDYQQIDILDDAKLRVWVERVRPDYVFHMAARTDLLGRNIEDYAANTRGVENILRVCSSVSSVRRVIFASSRMVCRIDHVPETYMDYSAPNLYGESKVEGERIVRAADVPFEWVLVRPTSIWGPGFGIPYRNFFDQIRKRRYFHPGAYRPKKSFGYVGNTVFQLIALMDAGCEMVDRKTFYLGDYEPIDICAWADYIHTLFDLPGSIIEVPVPLLRIAGKIGDFINWTAKSDRAPLTTFRMNNLITDMVYPQLIDLQAITGPLPLNWRTGSECTVRWMIEQ